MSVATGIHHINLLFADLDAAVRRFETLFGEGTFIFEDLPSRDVRTARVRLGDTWFVLVSPVDVDADTVPARHLRERGEGFFLLSFGVSDLHEAIDRLAALGTEVAPESVRSGLSDWRIADLPGSDSGSYLQLTEWTDNGTGRA